MKNKTSKTPLEALMKEANTPIDKLFALVTGRTPLVPQEIDADIILSIRNLNMIFGGLRAVDDLSFDIKKGQIYGLIGPNGAGKTTVFNCITQFYKENSGEILFRTNQGPVINLNHVRVDDVVKLGLVRTFQNVELIKDLSILDNVMIGGHALFSTNIFHEVFLLPKMWQEEKRLKEKAISILDFLGIGHLKNMYAMSLPYGISKKIELARTLMSNPNLVILDEPAAGLNDEETKELAKTLRVIRDEYKATILLVEHDMRLVMDVCDEICAISFGKKLAIGTPKQIQANPVVQEAYLGKADD